VALQRWAAGELQARGVPAGLEVPVRGAYRDKTWDVAWAPNGRARVAVSCKSILCDFTGAGPNRLDDLLGEASNLHRRCPVAAIGYLVVVARRDGSRDAARRRASTGAPSPRDELLRGDAWFDAFGRALAAASNRRPGGQRAEQWECICALQVDFGSRGLRVCSHPQLHAPKAFFDRLAAKR
jgi:hypothetical protein